MEFLVFIGLLLLIGAIFGGQKTPPPKPPVDPALEAERLARQKREDEQFKQAFEQWVNRLSGVIGGGRWIPKGAAYRFLVKHPAPEHPRKTWRQAVGDSSPEATLRVRFDKLNASHLSNQKVVRKDFFDTVEKNPLTDEQIHACICMDDAVLVVAAAGSGKTSTMVAKTGYALHEGWSLPNRSCC